MGEFSIAARANPSWKEIKAIADEQRSLLLALLASFLGLASTVALTSVIHLDPRVTGLLAVLSFVGARLWLAVAAYRLATALDSRPPLLWSIVAFLPNLIGLIAVAMLSSRATKRLTVHGFKVGLVGVKLEETPPPGFARDA